MSLFWLLQVLQPAIELAENGFPVSPVTAYALPDDINAARNN